MMREIAQAEYKLEKYKWLDKDMPALAINCFKLAWIHAQVTMDCCQAANTSAQITLPDGFELVSGDLSWQGDIAPDGQESFNFSIRTVETGNWTIEADAGYFITEDSWYGSVDYIYISVSEETAWVSKTPFPSDDTGARGSGHYELIWEIPVKSTNYQ